MTTLLVGRGLLGQAMLSELRRRGSIAHTVDVPWRDHRASVDALTRAADRAAAGDATWRLVWAAGAGVIATSEADLQAELSTFTAFLDRLNRPPGEVFLASSAGGVYAASPDPAPFTESSVVGSASAYGHAKLAMEAVAAGTASTGTKVLIGRIANLYGPGQNLAKPQGLVSQLCLSHLTRQPMTIYASFDSLRDYVFAPDAARMAVAALDRLEQADPGSVVTKILASGVSRSVGSVIGECTRAFRGRPHMVIRRAPSQIMDLRLRSTTWSDIDEQVDQLPFGAGLRRTSEDIGRQLRAGQLRSAVLPRRI